MCATLTLSCSTLRRFHGLRKRFLIKSSSIHQNRRSNHGKAKLEVTPRASLVDVLPKIKVSGLFPGQQVTLKAQTTDDKNVPKRSFAYYEADEDGNIDVSRSPSSGGIYTGVYPSGLLTTLRSNSGDFNYGRIFKERTYEPFQVTISASYGHQDQEIVESFDSVIIDRLFVTEGVKRITLKDGRIRGVLYLPSGEGPFPGVVDMFGAGGTFNETRSALSASRGIASLSLAYFKYEDLKTQKLFELDLEYFKEAVDYLTSIDGVIPDRCGVVGNCQGAFVGQLMGVYFEKVKAVFAINFPFISFFSDIKYQNRLIYEGFRLGPTHMIKRDGDFLLPDRQTQELLSSLDKSYIDDIINLPKDKFFHWAVGEDDCYDFTIGIKNVLEKYNNYERRNIDIKVYPKAGHIIDVPYTPTCEKAFGLLWVDNNLFPDTKHHARDLHWGGNPIDTVKMQEKTWQDYFDFFNQHIRDDSEWYQRYICNNQNCRTNNT